METFIIECTDTSASATSCVGYSSIIDMLPLFLGTIVFLLSVLITVYFFRA